jgi:hypothetical protein
MSDMFVKRTVGHRIVPSLLSMKGLRKSSFILHCRGVILEHFVSSQTQPKKMNKGAGAHDTYHKFRNCRNLHDAELGHETFTVTVLGK